MANVYESALASGYAGADYASSLQDILDVDAKKEGSRQSYEWEEKKRQDFYGTLSSGLSLISQFTGGLAEQRQAEADISELTGGKAEMTYGETSLIDLVNPFKIGEGGKIGWEGFGKAAGFGEGETLLGEIGERLGVLSGIKERGYDWEGKKYKQSELLSEAGLMKADKLAESTGRETDKSKTEDLFQEVQKLSDDEADKKKSMADESGLKDVYGPQDEEEGCPPGQIRDADGNCVFAFGG